MSAPSTLTGVITKITSAYDEGYGNITVEITVAGAEDKPILCYHLSGSGVDQIVPGDTITVTGTLTNYGGTIEFGSGCKIVE